MNLALYIFKFYVSCISFIYDYSSNKYQKLIPLKMGPSRGISGDFFNSIFQCTQSLFFWKLNWYRSLVWFLETKTKVLFHSIWKLSVFMTVFENIWAIIKKSYSETFAKGPLGKILKGCSFDNFWTKIDFICFLNVLSEFF